MFDADVYAMRLGIAGDLLQSLDAIVGPYVGTDRTAGRIVCIPPFVTRKGNDVRHTGRRAGVNRLLRAGQQLVAITRVVEPLHKRGARHAVGCDRARQTVTPQSRPIGRGHDLNGYATQFFGNLATPVDVPLFSGGVEAPEDDRMPDPPSRCGESRSE